MAVVKWTLPLLLLATGKLPPVVHATLDTGENSVELGNHDMNVAVYALISVCVFLVSISFIVACSWCYKFKGGFKPFDEHVLTEEQVIGNSYIDIGDFSTLNVDTLAHEHETQVQIEPLPTVHVQDPNRRLRTASSLSTVSGTLTHLQISRTQLNYVAEIGSGWFGKVLTGEAAKLQAGLKKTKVIIKQLKDDATFDEKNQFLLEAQPYRELKHANILSLVGQCTDSMPYLIVLEFCAFGDLKGFLLRRKAEATVLSQSGLLTRIACDIANGLEYMHRANMVHSDMSAKNCLVAVDMSVKIGDYGISQHRYKNDYYNTSVQGIKLPIRWMAPEMLDCQGDWVALRQSAMTKSANVWSFGVTLWELLEFGKRPYDQLTDKEVLQNVVVEQQLKLKQPARDVAYADRWYEIMLFCWLSADQRPIMAELCALLKHLQQQTSALGETTESFDEKWNSIRPKQVPTVVNAMNTTNQRISMGFESDFVSDSGNHTGVPVTRIESPPLVPAMNGVADPVTRIESPSLVPALNGVGDFPRTSTPAVMNPDNTRTPSNQTNTSSSMYYSANSTAAGSESGFSTSDTYLTPRTSSRSPDETIIKSPDAAERVSSLLATIPPPSDSVPTTPNDVTLSGFSVYNQSSTMSIPLSDSQTSSNVTQLETTNQSLNDPQVDNQIEITADVHMDSNIAALLSDSFDLEDDSIADNLTFSDTKDDEATKASSAAVTKETISTSVLASPKENTIIMANMPFEQSIPESSNTDTVIVGSMSVSPKQHSVMQVVLDSTDDDSISRDSTSQGKTVTENKSTIDNVHADSFSSSLDTGMGLGDGDVTVAMIGGDSVKAPTTGEFAWKEERGSHRNRTFQIVELDASSEVDGNLVNVNTPLVDKTDTTGSSEELSQDDSHGTEEEEQRSSLPSSPMSPDSHGDNFISQSIPEDQDDSSCTNTSVSATSDSEPEDMESSEIWDSSTTDIHQVNGTGVHDDKSEEEKPKFET